MDQGFNSVLAADTLLALTTYAWLKTYDPLPLSTVVFVLTTVPSISAYFLYASDPSSLSGLAWVYLTFYLTLIASVTAYRLSPFHPLAQYPGPMILKVTKLYGAWIAYTGKSHLYFKALHDQYGPTLRVGPNELSTVEKEFIPEILGNQGMPKGPLWDGRRFAQAGDSKDYDSIVDVRDSVIHTELRKPWNKAFSAEPMKDYEELLIERVVHLNRRLKEVCAAGENGTGRIDIAKLISCFAYDFMGSFAFGADSQLVQSGDPQGRIDTMANAMYHISITQHVPWISKLIRSLPIVNGYIQKFITEGIAEAMKRASAEITRKDLFYHMGEAAGTSVSDLPLIISNVLLAIVAGSDTTASVLSNVVYLLISHPDDYKKLQVELDGAFQEHGIELNETTSKRYGDVFNGLGYLNAVINEALRLFPAVPTGLQRAPAKGSSFKLLQGSSPTIFLPEGNAITVAPYALHRDPRYFSPRPDSFIPERWLPSPTSKTKYVTSRDAFVPFSIGPQNCAGRSLAMVEMRYVLAMLVRNFDMEFDLPKYDPKRWEKDLRDRFTLAKGSLGIRITPRKK
ncbi:hypothetical protein GALMADRAFT_757265 [Galerina marginata CBS 339.88]|uniref:Cytochrome P450 n=1 Tax=Galerina marginata (strain CBS 339.88) TaxID=685588 RepID=A0A067T0S7_GALM3|nr:hypothetical protein GALMADRAFT_757265 [Galerina marginata CBS 339.88]